MVELQLLQGRERAIALFGELEPPPLEGVGLTEPVLGGREPWTPQKRQGHDQDACDCK